MHINWEWEEGPRRRGAIDPIFGIFWASGNTFLIGSREIGASTSCKKCWVRCRLLKRRKKDWGNRLKKWALVLCKGPRGNYEIRSLYWRVESAFLEAGVKCEPARRMADVVCVLLFVRSCAVGILNVSHSVALSDMCETVNWWVLLVEFLKSSCSIVCNWF